MKKLNPEKKTILLSGSSGKIGEVLSSYLLTNNYNLIALCNREESYNKLLNHYADEIKEFSVYPVRVDLCSQTERSELINNLLENQIELYGFIHNARSLTSLVHDKKGYVNQSDFLSEFELGVYAPYDIIWQVASHPSINIKRIINISSIYGVVATNIHLYQKFENRLPLHYGIAKAALIHLTKELAVRLAEKNININAVSYGGVEGRVDEEFQKRYATLCPQAAMLKHEDLAGAVGFLLSEGAKSITGHNLMVDGGWTIW